MLSHGVNGLIELKKLHNECIKNASQKRLGRILTSLHY